MAKKENKISINALEKVMDENTDNYVIESWFGLEVVIKKNISLKEMLSFADNVVMSCFTDSNGFMPELMDFAVRSNIVTRYANFTLPDNIEKRYEMLYRTNIVEFILPLINMRQLQELINGINRKIEYMCNTNAVTIQREMTKLLNGFEEMQNQTQSLFADVTADDLSKLMAALAEHGSLDEEKVVKALVEQRKGDGTE